jgi:glycerophosphoryl diester phosphodiesterase
VRKPSLPLVGVIIAIAALYAANNSWSARPDGRLQVMSHRGVHHTYPREGLTRDSCTANRIHSPTHAFIENTIPSMRRAFELGADVVELDVHPTTDGEFAVFHDWTLDCRTQAKGVTREQTMAFLKTLDVGYGYTADGGRTYPLRGRGVAAMPTLDEVLSAFPDRRFMINMKSRDPTEADRLDAYLSARRHARPERLTFYGGNEPIARLRELRPQARAMSKKTLAACSKAYLLTGWSGHVPESCRNTIIFVPGGWGSFFWGWPNRFLARMQAVDTEVWLGGQPDFKTKSLNAIDDLRTFRRVPKGWRGGVDTDRIEVIGPAAKRRIR